MDHPTEEYGLSILPDPTDNGGRYATYPHDPAMVPRGTSEPGDVCRGEYIESGKGEVDAFHQATRRDAREAQRARENFGPSSVQPKANQMGYSRKDGIAIPNKMGELRQPLEPQLRYRAQSVRDQPRTMREPSLIEKFDNLGQSLWRQLREAAAQHTEASRRDRDLEERARRSQEQAEALAVELEEARSHIFSLQPYRKELTSKEAETDFDDLIGMIINWADKFFEPIVDDEEKCDELVAAAKKNPNMFSGLMEYIMPCPDLIYGARYPDTDVDILTAVMMRYVYNNIFRHDVFGNSFGLGMAVHSIAGTMRDNVTPKRDDLAIRNWRAEAFTAILSSPNYKRERDSRVGALTSELTRILIPFWEGGDGDAIFGSLWNSVIEPAVLLHEKFLASTHCFYLKMDPHMAWGEGGTVYPLPSFLESLDRDLNCRNILQCRSPLRLPMPGTPLTSRKENERDLVNVLTVTPGLFMSRAGAAHQPMTIRKQGVLVAYGPSEERENFIASGRHTLARRLFYE